MKQALRILVGVSLILIGAGSYAAEKAPQAVIDLANQELVKWGLDPEIVKAVKAENAKNKTLDQIKELDKKWIDTPGIDDFMKGILENECSKLLRKWRDEKPYFDEVFVMDNQGANVAMTDKTSDYWQGDEDKFKKSYNEGKGGVHIGDVAFDDSTQSYVVQVSVPVKEVDPQSQAETVIGAITIGINIDKFK